MHKWFLLFGVVASIGLSADDVKTPQQIDREYQRALSEFNTAKKMFNPYYTGPLITGSANNVPEGDINIQPYLYFTYKYASFNSKRNSVDTQAVTEIQAAFVFQYGVNHWLDLTLIPLGYLRWTKAQTSQFFGDTAVQLGFQLYKETPYAPSVRLILTQAFPTGRYRSLNPAKNGIDGTGGGVYVTSPGIVFSKVLWWFPLHPMAIRFAADYNIPDNRAAVRGFHAYGGASDTDGKVDVGQSYNFDLGVEYSLTQRWVLATDVVWSQGFKSTFSGRAGTNSNGTVAINGAPSNDNLSISPSIEYSPNETGGFIGGIWFPITGRNSGNFISFILSYTQLF